MPYSEYRVSDRKAIAQIRYQVRRFIKQAVKSGSDNDDVDKAWELFRAALDFSSSSKDFNDDGTPL